MIALLPNVSGHCKMPINNELERLGSHAVLAKGDGNFYFSGGDISEPAQGAHQLNDLDYKLPSLGETAIESIGRIDKLFTEYHGCGNIG